MNGSGDIQFEHIKEADFKALDPSHREWLLYKGVRSLSFTCHGRPSECSKKYVQRTQLVLAGVALVAFLAGYGTLQAKVILPALIKAALASAGMPTP